MTITPKQLVARCILTGVIVTLVTAGLVCNPLGLAKSVGVLAMGLSVSWAIYNA